MRKIFITFMLLVLSLLVWSQDSYVYKRDSINQRFGRSLGAGRLIQLVDSAGNNGILRLYQLTAVVGPNDSLATVFRNLTYVTISPALKLELDPYYHVDTSKIAYLNQVDTFTKVQIFEDIIYGKDKGRLLIGGDFRAIKGTRTIESTFGSGSVNAGFGVGVNNSTGSAALGLSVGDEESSSRNAVVSYFLNENVPRFWKVGLNGDLDYSIYNDFTDKKHFSISRGGAENFLTNNFQVVNFPPLETELCLNGDFSTDRDWVIESPTCFISGGLLHVGATISDNYIRQSVLWSGKAYIVKFSVSTSSTGYVRVILGNTKLEPVVGSGDYTFYGICSSSESFYIYFSRYFSGTIDNVSIKEITIPISIKQDSVTINANEFSIHNKYFDNIINISADLTPGTEKYNMYLGYSESDVNVHLSSVDNKITHTASGGHYFNNGSVFVGKNVTVGDTTKTTKLFITNPPTDSSPDTLFSQVNGEAQRFPLTYITNQIPWTSAGGKTYLKNINDNVGIGTTTPLHRISVLTSKATNVNGLNIVQTDWNKNRSTLAQATDTSNFNFYFTNGGKPMFNMRNNTGVSVMGLDSNSSLTLRGSLATNLPTYGAELLTSAGWTVNAGWTESPDDVFAHTSGGGVLTLTHSATIANNTWYQISWTITGRTTGSVDISIGGMSVTGITTTGTFGPKTISTAAFTITPTDIFNGTISVTSVKAVVTMSSPIFAAYNTAGTGGIEIRASSGLGGTALGYQAAGRVTTGISWTANGYQAGYSNTTGNYWTANGYAAGYSNTTGNAWTANGVLAGYSNTTGSGWTASGYQAGYSNTTGNAWTANGYQAGYSNTTGSNWTANGLRAGYSNTTGNDWTANGCQAGYSNTTGSNWTANGSRAGYSNTTGGDWTANGMLAGYSNTTGSSWTANGMYAGYSNTTGSNWTANGYTAGYSNTTGINWTANGFQAGRYLSDGLTGAQVFNNSTYFGANTKVSAESVTNENVFGYNATGAGSNTVALGDANIIKTIIASPKITGQDTTGAGSTANIGMMRYFNGHFYGLIAGAPPLWKQLDN